MPFNLKQHIVSVIKFILYRFCKFYIISLIKNFKKCSQIDHRLFGCFNFYAFNILVFFLSTLYQANRRRFKISLYSTTHRISNYKQINALNFIQYMSVKISSVVEAVSTTLVEDTCVLGVEFASRHMMHLVEVVRMNI